MKGVYRGNKTPRVMTDADVEKVALDGGISPEQYNRTTRVRRLCVQPHAERQKCAECGARVRGKNHESGEHHQRAIGKK